MKNKSFVKGDYLDLISDKKLSYCEIIAESYFKTTRAGVYTESTPNTTEILNEWFKPVCNAFILRNNYFYIGEWCTGILFDSYTQPDGVTVERLIFKPTENTGDSALAKKEYLKVYHLMHAKQESGRFGFIKRLFQHRR